MSWTDETGEYFDHRAADHRPDRLVDKWGAVRPLFDGVEQGHVVECGAGTGLYTLHLLAAGHRVTAVDVSKASLEALSEEAERTGLSDRLQIVVGDFSEVADDLEDVDVVAFIKVLHHLADRDAIKSVIGAGWRAVRSGGRLVVFEPNGASPVWPIAYLGRPAEWRHERNLRLVRPRFMVRTLEELPGASVEWGYRYVIPGTVTTRVRGLDNLDRRLSSLPGVRSVALNTWMRAVKVGG